MTVRIKRQTASNGLISEIEKKANVSLNKCFQCKKCSVGCPVSGHIKTSPSEIIRRLQFGAGKELLATPLIWTCLSCDTCTARCPNGIDFAAVIDALRVLAVENNIAVPQGNAPLFNKLFLNTVKSYGRTYDLQMIGLHKVRTRNLKQDMDKFPTMLRKGKMAILPPSGANRSLAKKVFKRAAKKD
jgi:heterodisulfide reductase subunit C2